MKWLLEINLFNGNNKMVKVDEELKEYLKYIEENGNYKEGSKNVWLGEEEMFVEL